MEIGYNKLNITPTQPVHIAGYNRKELSKGVLDPIEINSLVIKENNKTIIFFFPSHEKRKIGWDFKIVFPPLDGISKTEGFTDCQTEPRNCFLMEFSTPKPLIKESLNAAT